MALPKLETLKAESLQEQIDTIERLAEQNLEIAEEVRSLFESRSADSVFKISVSADASRVTQLALLSIVAADIATIPAQRARTPYLCRLDRLCAHFGVSSSDLTMMVQHATQIRGFLDRRAAR